MEKISWTDHVRNEEVLLRVNEQRNILHEIRKRKANWIGHILRRNCLLQGPAERTPRFWRDIASGEERVQWWGVVVEQRCMCRFQCIPWRGRETIEPLLLRSLYKMAGRRYQHSVHFASASRLVDGILFLIRKRFTVGYQTLDKQVLH